MSQYDMTIIYIPDEDNSVADALSHVPDGAYPGEQTNILSNTVGIYATLSITMNPTVFHTIQNGYKCQQILPKDYKIHTLHAWHLHIQWPLVHWGLTYHSMLQHHQGVFILLSA